MANYHEPDLDTPKVEQVNVSEHGTAPAAARFGVGGKTSPKFAKQRMRVWPILKRES